MANIDLLVQRYERFITPAWPKGLAGPQRVIFVVYDPRDERRLRARLGEFELATKRAGRNWVACDVTETFPQWMARQKYREAYFEDPSDLAIAMSDFESYASERVRNALSEPLADANSVVAVYGVASLFGFMRVSKLISSVENDIRGRLLLFFPGQYDNNTYRLLDARDGWNYHAIPITAQG
jgi:hypothetical protein